MTGRRLALALVVSAALLLAAMAALVVVAMGPTTDVAGHASVDLDALQPELASLYRYAASHERELAAVPCFCGCQEFLGHRNLKDCFVRDDGTPEPHAAGCGVCSAEAVLVRTVLRDGGTPVEARDAVIAIYGATPGTAPPPTAPEREAT